MSTRRTEWHVAEQDLADYLAGGRRCRCRRPRSRRTCSAAPPAGRRLAQPRGRHRHATQAWQRLADAIDRPSPTLLGRLSHGHRFARSSVATPAMVQAALAVGRCSSGWSRWGPRCWSGDAGLVTLLVLAPLAPVAAVAVAYRDWADPAGEISLATPSAGLRLVALRALVVSLAALPWPSSPCSAVDLWVEDVPIQLAVAWCLPGLALAALVLLAGTTRLDPLHVAARRQRRLGVAVVTAATVRRSLRPEIFIDILASPAMQSRGSRRRARRPAAHGRPP